MSLCSLIYNSIQGISSANDLIQIINIGNEFYSTLSWLARQTFLKQSELPKALNVSNAVGYQLDYSENYSGTVHQETAVEGYQYCTFLQRAFESLISENYTNFIVTIRCIAVAIYCCSNIGFKLFYSLEICMVEGSLKTRVFLSKHCPLIAKCIIFRVYTTVIYLKWEEYKLRILKIGWFLKTVWMKPKTLI